MKRKAKRQTPKLHPMTARKLHPRRKYGSSRGTYYEGAAAAYGEDDSAVILIASNTRELAKFWKRMCDNPLQLDLTKRVCVFSAKDTKART
jgi:hypothetical protein